LFQAAGNPTILSFSYVCKIPLLFMQIGVDREAVATEAHRLSLNQIYEKNPRSIVNILLCCAEHHRSRRAIDAIDA
jgi:hypothetical protein